jgi:hypothetical protein
VSDVKKKLTAAELIAKKKTPAAISLPPALEKELRALCAHNDTAGRNRIGRREAIEMCKSHGVSVGHDGLDRLCRTFGRSSYAQK